MTAGLLLVLGLVTAPTGAALASTGDTSPPTSMMIASATPTSCLAGVNNTYEFYDLCKGTSPASYRTIALCADGNAVLGAENTVGSGNLSYANCKTTGGLASTLNGDWGILLCSNSTGAGTFQGYIDKSSDISWIPLKWGNGNIATGGGTLCDFSTSVPAAINPNVAPT